jgi:hypothetical protein
MHQLGGCFLKPEIFSGGKTARYGVQGGASLVIPAPDLPAARQKWNEDGKAVYATKTWRS